MRSSSHASMRSLIRLGINVNEQDAFGDTALHWAVRVHDIAAVQVLLSAGANPRIENDVKRR